MSKQVTVLQEKRKGKKKGTKDRKHLKAKEARIAERRFKVLNLRVAGWSQEEIAREVGACVATVGEDIRTILKDTLIANAETAEELRQIQGARLDQIVKGHLTFASQSHKKIVVDRRTQQAEVVEVPPDSAAAQIVLQAEQRRAKLYGLDTPDIKTGKQSGIRIYVGVDMEDL